MITNNKTSKTNSSIVFGIRPIIEAIKSGKEIEKVLMQPGLKGELFPELSKLIKQFNIPYQKVPVEKLNRITTKNHQGVIAFISPIEYNNIENLLPIIFEQGKIPLILVLDRITDVRNFGAIARTAECAGVDAIIISDKGNAPVNADAIKTSAGALNIIPVCRTKNLKDTLQYLKNSGLTIFAATEKGNEFYYSNDFSTPCAIVMGSEEDGISGEYLKLCDKKIKIPIIGNISSLNVSVASGIIIYEALRQRALKH
jgi:23S rRNA (guanosine2251-2'-O)-methyltransferase